MAGTGMMNLKSKWTIVIALLLSAAAHAVGTEEAAAPDPDDKPLALRIWYPNTAAQRRVVHGRRLPLIVISHGTGGSNDNHADTANALAQAGFVVVAITHTGDNYRDQSYVHLRKHLSERPRHVARTLDYMLTRWHAHQQLNATRVGLFGFSAGGFTALVMAGGIPDLGRVQQHCRQTPTAWDCEYLRKNSAPLQPGKSEATIKWMQDPRIKVAVIAAPALGYSFEPQGLSEVRIPIQVWSAERDRVVDSSASTVRKLLPNEPEFHPIANAGHFSFIQPCGWVMHGIITVMTWFGTEAICSDPDGFNRQQFHQTFNIEVTRFFRRELR